MLLKVNYIRYVLLSKVKFRCKGTTFLRNTQILGLGILLGKYKIRIYKGIVGLIAGSILLIIRNGREDDLLLIKSCGVCCNHRYFRRQLSSAIPDDRILSGGIRDGIIIGNDVFLVRFAYAKDSDINALQGFG